MDEPDKTKDRITRQSCPVCLGKNFIPERKVRDHVSLSQFTVSRCKDCTVRFISDPPSPDVIQKHYQNPSGQCMHSEGSPVHQKLRELLFRSEMKPLLKRIPPDSHIIDYGAGDGGISGFFQKMGFKVSAMDMYPSSEWSLPSVEYRQMDLNKPSLLSFETTAGNTSVRAVILRHVLEHLCEPANILTAIRDAGAKYVVIIVPNYKSILRPVLGEYWYYWDPPRHLTYFTERSLYCLAERSGYKLLESTTYAVDDLITSLHRYMLLNQAYSQTELARKIVSLTDPKSALAGISSAIASFFGNCMIHAVFEKYKQH
jgi:hypothetical protein